MTETVQVALITFLAGAVGAAGGLFASKISADAQIKQTIVQEYLKRRADAFETVFLAERELYLHRGDQDAVEKFSSAVDSACISLTPDNAKKILLFKDAMAEHSDNAELIAETKAAAIIAMQEELMVFMRPKIVKNIWGKLFFLKRIREFFGGLRNN